MKDDWMLDSRISDRFRLIQTDTESAQKMFGEDVATGFGHARTIYTSRAESKMQAFLYCFLPINILVIGLLLLVFFIPTISFASDLLRMIEGLGSYG